VPDERAELVRLVRDAITGERYLLSLRMKAQEPPCAARSIG
jgi:hypothetical protein